MARQRRGGGFRPELRGTLGTLLRTAAAQVGPLREALERGAREGRSRLDDALSGRRRQDALAELGEIVLDLIRRGEIDLGEVPEVRDVVAHLDELDADHPPEHDERIAPPPARKRFDARPRDEADGTVASRAWSRARDDKPTKQERVWRPPVNVEMAPAPEVAGEPVRRKAPTADLKKQGGIQFDDDDDLADYMHPDDVPPKGSGGSDA